jgi:hypothetical protein
MLVHGHRKSGLRKTGYFAWSYGKDEKEFLDRQEELDETMAETLGETMKQLNAELIKHITRHCE